LENKINEDKTLALYTSPIELLNEWMEQPSVNNVKYIGVIFDKKITCILYTEMAETNDFETFIRLHSLFKRNRLYTNIKLTLHTNSP
jgi:hypothetical protein